MMKILRLLPALILAALGVMHPPSFAPAAQEPYQWSTPERIPDYSDIQNAPLLVADGQGIVHAFDLETRGVQEYFIMHRTWDPARGWSTPVDVLLAPFLGMAPGLLSVYLDPTEELHLIFIAGADGAQQIYYTHVPIERAAEARAWAKPLELPTDTGRDSPGKITGDGANHLVIVYGGTRFGDGLYEVHSMDGGETWTEPKLISRSQQPGVFPGTVWLEPDAQGNIHTTWSTFNVQGMGQEVRYGRLEAGLEAWGDEVVLATKDNLDDLGWPSVISTGGEIVLAYQDGYPPTRWVRRSADGGESWSDPVRPFPHRGNYGFTGLVKDSLKNIHMVLGNRLQDPEIHGMWYSRLLDHQWLPLFAIASGPPTETFSPCCPQIVVTRGNLLLATWKQFDSQDPTTGAPIRQHWYSYLYLPAPQTPLDTKSLSETSTPSVTTSGGVSGNKASPEAPATPRDTPSDTTVLTSPREVNPGRSIYLGLVPVAVFAAWLFLRRTRRGTSGTPEGEPGPRPARPKEGDE